MLDKSLPREIGQLRDKSALYVWGTGIERGIHSLTEAGKQALIARMEQYLPAAPLTFMIELGADAVAAELAGGHASGRE